MKNRKEFLTFQQLLDLEIQFPSCQREQIEEHVKEIVDYQKEHLKRYGSYCFLGCLELCHLDGKYYCIDGQHRYHSIYSLYNNSDGHGNILEKICVEIIECSSKEEMLEYFNIINKNQPLPDFIKFIEEPILILKEYIKTHYSGYVKNTNQPRRPNINVDIFLDNISKKYGEVLKSRDIIEWFETENREHGMFLESRKDDIVLRTIDKIKEPKLYLGCFWLDPIPSKISTVLRRKVWYKYYKDLSTKCPCCGITNIQIDDFDCGHIVSKKNGGETSIDNLRPICRSCNQSMSHRNWDVFVRLI